MVTCSLMIICQYFISSDVIDVTTDLTLYSLMINAERLTKLSANLDGIESDIDTDSGDTDTCYGIFINKLNPGVWKMYASKTITVKYKKIIRPWITKGNLFSIKQKSFL